MIHGRVCGEVLSYEWEEVFLVSGRRAVNGLAAMLTTLIHGCFETIMIYPYFPDFESRTFTITSNNTTY